MAGWRRVNAATNALRAMVYGAIGYGDSRVGVAGSGSWFSDRSVVCFETLPLACLTRTTTMDVLTRRPKRQDIVHKSGRLHAVLNSFHGLEGASSFFNCNTGLARTSLLRLTTFELNVVNALLVRFWCAFGARLQREDVATNAVGPNWDGASRGGVAGIRRCPCAGSMEEGQGFEQDSDAFTEVQGEFGKG